MQLTGMLHGSKLLEFVDFPAAAVLGPEASEDEIGALIEKHSSVFVKPIFKGGVGKKGKSGLIGRATDLKTALREKERLYFVEHRVGNVVSKAQGVTFEGAVPAEHEVYFALSDSTRFRAPTITLTHEGGIAIEELEKTHVAEVPFEALTGLKAFVVANALADIGAPREIISPLVQNLPKLWELFHHYGLTTLELNPIRMSPGRGGRLVPVACDFKCGFDRDDPRRERLSLPASLFAGDYSDFGGNPPFEKMHDVARICFKYWLAQSNVLFIIGGKSNNTDIYETFRAMAHALREHFGAHGPTPLYVVVGRGGPNLVRGMGAMRDTVEALGLPYRFFGFDSAMSEVVNYALAADRWMKQGGRKELARAMGLPPEGA